MTREPDMPTYYELHTEVERLVGIVAVRNDEAGKLRAEIEQLKADNHRLMMWNEELQAKVDALDPKP